MERSPKFDKYAKAKIGEPNLPLPKAILKFNTDPSTGELCYVKIFEDDTKKHKHIAEEMAAGAKLDRKVYQIRTTELYKVIGNGFEDMQQIHQVSKASIGLVADPDSDLHSHSFVDLMGTVEQVKMAEELILDKIIKTYEGPVYPVILMPPTICGHEISLHVGKVVRLLGKNAKNALALEAASGAWLQVDKPLPGGPTHERRVNIYGPKAHVVKAVSLIYSQVFEPGESLEAEEDLDMLLKELSLSKMMDSGSGSGQTEEQHGEDQKANRSTRRGC